MAGSSLGNTNTVDATADNHNIIMIGHVRDAPFRVADINCLIALVSIR